jgi:hypothetical protein
MPMSAKRPNPLKDRPTDDQQIDVLMALRTAPDHALAITAAAYVDYAVEMILRDRLRVDKDEDGRIFDGAQNGILATAASKITLAYALRFIEASSLTDLRIVNRVRNIFAHSLHQIDFKHPDIAAQCRKLSLIHRRSDMYPDAETADPRNLYWNTCLDFFAAMQFDRRGIREDGTILVPAAEDD